MVAKVWPALFERQLLGDETQPPTKVPEPPRSVNSCETSKNNDVMPVTAERENDHELACMAAPPPRSPETPSWIEIVGVYDRSSD